MNETGKEASDNIGGPIFQPDTVLPSQFFASLRGKGFVEGEKRLMAAVLADAVDCYMKHVTATETHARQLFLDAESWIFWEEGVQSLFSFRQICDVLGLEPGYIRQGLRDWRLRRVPTIRPVDALQRRETSSRTVTAARELEKAAG